MYPSYNIMVEHAEDVKVFLINKDIILSTKADGETQTVSVKDFEVGLSDHQKDRIFERFYRVDDKNRTASGLGIGLYICLDYQISSGKFGVNSKLHYGSAFFFILPING